MTKSIFVECKQNCASPRSLSIIQTEHFRWTRETSMVVQDIRRVADLICTHVLNLALFLIPTLKLSLLLLFSIEFRERNDDENTPLQLFDELEIHPVVLDIEKDESPQMLSTFRYCLSVIGPTRNYGEGNCFLKRGALARRSCTSVLWPIRLLFE